ncbi:MAG TPA: DUF6328 family protein [Polyangiaceae bacterium]|nr:DUF6328 family protein [Polyangiaceae bacterium]
MNQGERDTEPHEQRINRELTELLGELRVALPGVQMLFAFLLTVPFSARFPLLSWSQHAAFSLAFASTTVAAIFLIAPSSNHRMSFRAPDKERLLFRSNRFAIIGIAFLAVAICAVAFFISGMLYGDDWAPGTALATFALIFATWYLMPLLRRARRISRAS